MREVPEPVRRVESRMERSQRPVRGADPRDGPTKIAGNADAPGPSSAGARIGIRHHDRATHDASSGGPGFVHLHELLPAVDATVRADSSPARSLCKWQSPCAPTSLRRRWSERTCWRSGGKIFRPSGSHGLSSSVKARRWRSSRPSDRCCWRRPPTMRSTPLCSRRRRAAPRIQSPSGCHGAWGQAARVWLRHRL